MVVSISFKFKLDVNAVKGRTKSYDEGLTCFVTEECFNVLTSDFSKTDLQNTVLISLSKSPKHTQGLLVQVLPLLDSPHLPNNTDTLYASPNLTLRLDDYHETFLKTTETDDTFLYAHPIRSSTVAIENLVLYPTSEDGFYNQTEVDSVFKQSLLRDAPVITRNTCISVVLEDSKLQYLVLDCSPLIQGVITADTSVILVKPETTTQETEDTTEDNASENSANVPLVISSILLPQLKFDSQETGPKSVGLPMHMSYMIVDVLPLHFWENAKEDDNLFIGVTMKTLRKLQVFHGSWVRIISVSNRNSYLSKVHAIDTLSRPETYKDDVIYVSSTLLFNLNMEVEKSRVVLEPASPQSIPVATTVQLARIRSYLSDNSLNCLSELRNYFRVPRMIREGHIFGIPVLRPSELVPEIEFSDSEEEFSDEEDNVHIFNLKNHVSLHSLQEFVYFKVTKAVCNDMKPDLLWLDKGITSVTQLGAVNSRIPSICGPLDIPSGLEQPTSTLLSLLQTCLHAQSSALGLRSATVLLRGARGSGEVDIVGYSANRLGVHLYEVNCYEILGQIESQTEAELQKVFDKYTEYSPCILYLRNIHALEKTAQPQMQREPRSVISNRLRECIDSFLRVPREYPLFIVGSTDKVDQLSGPLRAIFRHEIVIDAPDESQRLAMLSSLVSRVPKGPDVSVKELATLTASLTQSNLHTLVIEACLNAITRVTKKYISNVEELSTVANEIARTGFCVTWQDFEKSISQLKSSHASSIGAPKIPKVSWEDVGGLGDAKKDILDTIQLPLQYPSLFAEGMRKRSGVCLYGPPGTGKTLMAKAVATECSLNFLSVKGPELINMYVGESEKNVRDLFQKARAARPCVIFFDELDSLAPNRGKGADSGGVMDRIVSQLLAELDGMQKSGDLFVIGATNRPDLIDPALLRPGRFDKLIYLGISESHDTQLKILKALTRKFNLSPTISLENVANKCPLNLTGADFYALCSDALLTAITDYIDKLEQMNEEEREIAKKQDNFVVLVDEDHFLRALQRLQPSVSEIELNHYKQLRDQFTKKEE